MSDGDRATAELLATLDELYPLDDDDKRTERIERTEAALKRWMVQTAESLAVYALRKALRMEQERRMR